jgi:hypothetical protein
MKPISLEYSFLFERNNLFQENILDINNKLDLLHIE